MKNEAYNPAESVLRKIADEIFDELQSLSSYGTDEIWDKIREKGYDPKSDEGRDIQYYINQIDFDPGRFEVEDDFIDEAKSVTIKEMIKAALDEKLKGGQKKLDVAEPKGKITAADFDALRKQKMAEDLDIGHQDDEPDMLKADVYRIAEYALDLYKMLDQFDQMKGEVDFPDWWQQKIHIAAEYMDKAKHYLEFEMKQPAVDRMASVAPSVDLNTLAENVAKKIKEARFKKGTDIGKPGKGFEKIAKSAAKQYGSEEAGKRVAGAVLKKILAKK